MDLNSIILKCITYRSFFEAFLVTVETFIHVCLCAACISCFWASWKIWLQYYKYRNACLLTFLSFFLFPLWSFLWRIIVQLNFDLNVYILSSVGRIWYNFEFSNKISSTFLPYKVLLNFIGMFPFVLRVHNNAKQFFVILRFFLYYFFYFLQILHFSKQLKISLVQIT